MNTLAEPREQQLQQRHFETIGKEWRAAAAAAKDSAEVKTIEPQLLTELPATNDVFVSPPSEAANEPPAELPSEITAPRISILGDFSAIVREDFDKLCGIPENSAFGHHLRKQSEKLGGLADVDFSRCDHRIYVSSYSRGSNIPVESIELPLTPSWKIPDGATILRGDGLLNVEVVRDALGGSATIFNEWMWAEGNCVDVLDARSASDPEFDALWEPLPEPPAPEPPSKLMYRQTQPPITLAEIAACFHRCECGTVIPNGQRECDLCQR